MPRRPSRTTGWSSTISSRIGVTSVRRRCGGAPIAGRRPRSPSRRPAPTRSRACRRRAPTRWRIAVSPKPVPRSGRRDRGTSKPTPSSRTSSATDVAHVGQGQAGSRARGVLGDVGQRLLGGPQQGDLDLGMERQPSPVVDELDRDAVERRPALRRPRPSAVRQRAALQRPPAATPRPSGGLGRLSRASRMALSTCRCQSSRSVAAPARRPPAG